MGDINDDGYDDVVVAAPLWRNASGNAVGKVFGFYGSPDGLSETPDWSLVHPGTTSDGDVWGNLPLEGILGWSISDGGDINGDGIDDLVVGGRGAYENDTTDGGDHPLMTKYFIFEGSSASLSDSPDDVLSRLGGDHLLPASSGNGGTEFSLGGDENQDGYDDLMVPGTTASRFPSAAPLNTHWVIHYGSASGLDHSVGVKIHKNMFPDSPSGSWGYITQAELDGNFNGSGGADPMAFISRETPNFPRSSTGLHVFTAGKNPPPAADDQAVMVGRSESLQISFQASDPYDDPLSYEVTSPPQAGSLSSLETDAGTVTYQAPEDFAGPDPFNFTVTDSYDRNTTATIEVTVTNGAPVFNEPPAGATYTTRVGDRLTVPVDVTDPEGDNLTKRSPQFPDGTSIRWEDGEVRWTPDADQTGEYTLVLEADDGFDTTTREVSMTVNPAAGDTGPCSGPGADTQDRCPPGMDAGSTDGHNPADSTGSSGCTCSAGEGQTVSRGLIVACLSITLMLIRLRTRSVSTT